MLCSMRVSILASFSKSELTGHNGRSKMNHDYSLLPYGQQLGMFFIYKAKKNKLVAELFSFRKDIQMGFLDPYVYNFCKILQLADLCNCMIIVYEIDHLGSFNVVEEIKFYFDTEKKI